MKRLLFSGFLILAVNLIFSQTLSVHKKDQSKVDIPLMQIDSITFSPVVQDVDGNYYQTAQIGTQLWMAENLKTTKYNDGSPIPTETDNTIWSTMTTPAYCWYDNDETNNKPFYGALYNWYTINTGNLCPSGWHVPSDDEWKTLEIFLGMSQLGADSIGYRGTNQGGKLKEAGTIHWWSPNTGADNSSGFTALGGGYRYGGYDGTFYQLGHYGVFWASNGFYRHVMSERSDISRTDANKSYGYSVRCLKN